MDVLSRVLSMLSVILLVAGFIMLIRQIKKTSRMSTTSHVLSMSFSLILLLFNIFVLKNAKISWWFAFLLIFGAGFGFAWGTTTRLKMQDNHIIGKRSVLYIYFWLASILVTQVLAFFAKTNVVAFGLAGMFFSTGASLGTNSNIIYRVRKLVGSSIPKAEKTDYEALTAEKSGMQTVRTWQEMHLSRMQPVKKKPFIRAKEKPGRVVLWLSGGFVSLLLIGVVLARFVLPNQIFSQDSKSADLGQGINNDDSESDKNEMAQDTPIVKAQSEEKTTRQPEKLVLVTPVASPELKVQPDSGDAFLLLENFNSVQLSAAPLYNIEYMRYFNAEGYGVIESAVHPGLLPIIFPQVQVSDFVAEFDFMMPEASYDSSCGLLFRANAKTKGELDQYYALFLYPKTNVLKMGVFIDDQLSFSPPIEPDPQFHLGYETNHIKLEAEGENMNIYLNDVFVTGISEGSLRDPGWIGLFLYPSDFLPAGGFDYVLFDNLKIFTD